MFVEESLKFIESQEMREYLNEYGANNPNSINMSDWCKLVCRARAPLEEKAATLEAIALKYGNKADDLDITKIVESARNALDERYARQNNVVFRVTEDPYCDFKRISDAFSNFDTAVKYIQSKQRDSEQSYFEVGKEILDDTGNLRKVFCWDLNSNGDIWFFNSMDENEIFKFSKKLGDIITIDCRPYADIMHGVIIVDIDEYDPYCVEIGDDEQPHIIKLHSASGMGSFGVSPIFRAKLFKGELPEHEKPLKAISEALKVASGKEMGALPNEENESVINLTGNQIDSLARELNISISSVLNALIAANKKDEITSP